MADSFRRKGDRQPKNCSMLTDSIRLLLLMTLFFFSLFFPYVFIRGLRLHGIIYRRANIMGFHNHTGARNAAYSARKELR